MLFKLFSCCYATAPAAQTCYVINSIPATPPTSGHLDTLVSATSQYYSTLPTRIYNSWDLDGVGTYTEIPASDPFWINTPQNRCGLWGSGNPKSIVFSVCVNIPADTSYYMGFGADNSGTVTIDGVPVLENVSFQYWGIYKIALTKGIHFVGFSVVNFDVTTPASIGFEIYDNTEQQIINAGDYYQLNLIYSTKNELGKTAQAGDPATTYSCPVGYISDFCSTTTTVPVCSQFVPLNLVITNPPAACLSAGVDLTAPQITAGSPSGLTYTYWKDSLATIPLANPNKITASGTYYIRADYNGCYMIRPVRTVVNFTTSTVQGAVCLGSSYLGHTKSGAYADTLIGANGCDSIRTLNLVVSPLYDTTLNVAICNGDSYEGHSKSGIFTDTLATANGCDSLVTTNLTVGPNLNLGPARELCLDDSIVLNPGSFSHYLWQDGSTLPYYRVVTGGIYWVKVTDANGCMGSDTVAVSETVCSTSKIPNTFTPNGDGINDTWTIDGLQAFPTCTVFIYTRWGQLIFKSTGYGKAFDGTYNDKELPVGVYYYVINLNNNSRPLSGFVTIIR